MIPSPRLAALVFLGLGSLWLCQETRASPPADSVEFFEQRIRPMLVEHCYECHSAATEQAGGLQLDSRAGWQLGGDSGPAIVPHDAQASRLIRVIDATDADLEMPPDGTLPAAVIEDFRRWVQAGAVDPRDDDAAIARPPGQAIDWEAARRHWAYQPLQPVSPPESGATSGPQAAPTGAAWPRGAIDRFVLRRLHEHSLQPSLPAQPAELLRRVSVDLSGLPPTPAAIMAFLNAEDQDVAYERVVDQLLASPDFAHRFARHWLDVTRYAESVTLRGLIFPHAWRFRDYIIQSLDQDRSWKEVILEHVAGDLLELDSVADRQRAQVAVTFLCMGNSNLEEQQKRSLEMDHIDEQLDTLGRAMLGQTLGCARCHDHKFDPIPTSDYYAMAGILHGYVGLNHANVSRWIDNPLPLAPEEEQHFESLASELEQVTQALTAVNRDLKRSTGPEPQQVSSSSLPGVVIDDAQAQRVGQWTESRSVKPFVDKGYLHDGARGRGEKSLLFEPQELTPGTYELRLAYCSSGGRSTRTLITVFSADGEQEILVNQRQRPDVDGLWQSLGRFRFEPAGQAFVLISNQDADGHVIADAIHFLPVAETEVATGPAAEDAGRRAHEEQLRKRQQKLTRQQAALQQQLASRPQAMGLRPREAASDLPIHIRGSIHTLGPLAPRGALQVLSPQRAGSSSSDSQASGLAIPSLQIAPGSCGRLELAHWIANDANPLTTRVLVNRIWLWVMGQGLVRTPDNFGTTGQAPTHPELLDWLTTRFVEDQWSIKRLVKQIVMSATYRQSSRLPAHDDPRWSIDPENRLLWRSDRKPMSAEAIRDTVLAISGELDSTLYGSRIRPGTTNDYEYPHDPRARSIYLPAFRNSTPEILAAFNFTDPNVVTGQRDRGIIAQQALLIFNHPWFAERAAAAARRNLEEVQGDLTVQVNHAFIQTLARPATAAELDAAIAYCQATLQETGGAAMGTASDAALQDALAELYHGLFATAEFRQLD